MTAIRVRCAECRRILAGRLPRNPRNHREVGDGTLYFPRRHRRADGGLCPGIYLEAEIVEEPRP